MATDSKLVANDRRKILYYQSPMHPWIRSDQPGKCTVCGMDLVPIFEGEKTVDIHSVALGSNAVTVVGVATQAAVRGPLHRQVHFIGVLDDDDTRHQVISATADGRIDWLADNYEGAEFYQGQPVVRLYSPLLLGAIREFIGLEKSAESGDNRSGLREGAILRLRQLGLTTEQIVALPQNYSPTNLLTELLAPRDGTVVKRLAYPGQYVKEGDPLFEIGDFGVLWLKFDAYERDLPAIEIGHPVEFTVTGHPGRRFTNEIVFIDPNIDPLTRTAKVRALVPNPKRSEHPVLRRQFSHRSAAEVDLIVTFPQVVKVPRTAILNPGGMPRLFVEIRAGIYEARTVRLGQRGDDEWEILDGVREGERVVTQGGFLLDSQIQLAGGMPRPVSAPLAQGDGLGPPLWIVLGDRARIALSNDDLAAYREELHALRSAPAPKPVSDVTSRLVDALPMGEVVDILAARRAFLPFSEALVNWGAELRKSDPSAQGLKLFSCPMGNGIFPGAPSQARWLQLSGPIANPWYGVRMIDCGSEIHPEP